MITPKQRALYFRLWGQVRRQLRTGGYTPAEADKVRKEIHEREIGSAKSSNDLSNPELDKIFAAFRAMLPGADLNTQLDAMDQPRKRLIWKIRSVGLTEGYIMGVAQDRFGTRKWEKLEIPKLEQLRITMIERGRAFARRNKTAPQPQQEEIPF